MMLRNRSKLKQLTGMAALLWGALGFSLARAQVKTDAGLVEGLPADASGIRAFKGIPFAAPPIGDLRWKAPQPAAPWTGVRQAVEFGPRAMQGPIYSDMIFRDAGPSEDCLYLNVWTPSKTGADKLPVMVWIYGGGFQAGSSSEPRQDGAILAKKGVVIVSMNYRLGLFGFFAHPGLAAENSNGATGNYGLMDQIAALQWVKRNIAAFGGDPHNVTIFGESAGSEATFSLMASPMAHGLFQRAIGQSGSFAHSAAEKSSAKMSRSKAEARGVAFATAAGAASIEELRQKPAAQLLKLALSQQNDEWKPVIDGSVLPDDPNEIFSTGRQNDVPLLVGWTADEMRAYRTFGDKRPTAETFRETVRQKYGDDTAALLKLYPATSDKEAVRSAGDLADDRSTCFAIWKWLELQGETGHSPIYHYSFDHTVPVEPGRIINGAPATATDIGAVHASDIGYVFAAFDSAPMVPWKNEDRRVSDTMMTYWTNFARTGNPNGPGIPNWPEYNDKTNFAVMHLDTASKSSPASHRDRYKFLDAYGVRK
ncbi:MAG TPA: carboxylesterase/lipase family protein [Lacunisphaera sp.]|jgi:para-nitrobenzyl esterase